MTSAVFVAPYGMDATLRFVRGAAALPEVRLGVISEEPASKLAPELKARLAGFERVDNALDPQKLIRAVRALAPSLDGRVDCLMGILEQLQEPLALVREELEIRGMDAREALRFRDKSVMKERLREHDLPCARHGLATDAAEALAFAKTSGYPLVVKPPAGAGARNTIRVGNDRELASYLRSQPPHADQPLLLEEFVTGIEHSLDTVTLNGQHLFHSISRYAPTPLEVMEAPWVQWCVLLPRRIDGPEHRDAIEIGRKALDALGMVTGMSHLEWFRRPDGSLAISEVGARPPGAQFTSLISWAHDLDFYTAWARLMIFGEFDVPKRRWAVGAVYLRGTGPGKIRAVRGIEEAKAELGELIVEGRLPKTGAARGESYEGDGYLILRHPETAEVERGLERLLELVRVEVH